MGLSYFCLDCPIFSSGNKSLFLVMCIKSHIFTLLMFLGFAVSCNDMDEADPVILFVTPNTTEATANDAIYFDISSWAENSQIVRIEVVSFDRTYGSQVVYSDEPMVQKYDYRFTYRLPIYFEDQSVEFTFYATDGLGNRQDMSVSISVRSADQSIEELSGITLYSPLSGRSDAFSFELLQSVNTQNVDASLCDIYVPLVDGESGVLPRLWASSTDLRFSKVNNFAYSKATYKSVVTVYENAVISPVVEDLSNEDIIIVGRNGRAIAVIRIANIYDGEGVSEDRYDINMKVLPKGDMGDVPVEDTGEE